MIAKRWLHSTLCRSSVPGLSFLPPTILTQPQKKWADKQFASQPLFIKSCSEWQQAPATTVPEVAFVGRSNVGKSTLINRLTNNNQLVKTSSKPGHTKLLNFFQVCKGKLNLVDMPGYGYRSQAEWGDMILEYLHHRQQLKRLFVLIDPTAGLKEWDRMLFDHLDERGISYQLILTKSDKLSAIAFDKSKEVIEQDMLSSVSCYPQFLYSGIPRRSRKNAESVAEDLTRIRWAVLQAAGYSP
ncbi:P-loop containing nucleoside triphosphate hydrolase protein [Hesseltinella vesiculosa]|uniref:GTP-binding protein 8 n=1 Tax=Hesseltinella vesiculosa TaxID=101127 RepID=A0A1X2G246_9FUNG|nr:P-loop containing nucleoside triphosphate hydrolase protein [Hesseltinella vesiculosa]